MDEETLSALSKMQQGEITEHKIYSNLAAIQKGAVNRKVLERIAADELKHYGILKDATKKEFGPSPLRVWFYTSLGRTLGLEFTLKIMENGEVGAQAKYARFAEAFPAVKELIKDEEKHEAGLIDMISEERLNYASAIVLGLNDALVELTGALAGLTLAFQNGTFIGVSGLVIGIAAALSMAASSYLSTREEGVAVGKTAFKSATYTGITYMLTVLILISPYFFIDNVYAALGGMLAIALVVIASYTFYISTAKSQKFFARFAEMAAISLAVAGISFAVGYFARILFGLGV